MNTSVKIYPHERVDDLQIKDLRLIQNPKQFCFGVDAVLLTYYAAQVIKPGAEVLDMCSGNGIIPVLLTAKSAAAHIDALELQQDIAEMSRRSVQLNGLEDKISVTCGDLKNGTNLYNKGSFDCITCNPPYKEAGGGILGNASALTIARHEIHCTLKDVISISAQLLKPGGKLCMVHRPERLADIITYLREYRIEPKRLRFVHPSPYKAANLILIQASKHGNQKLFLDPPLYIYDENGNYSAEINEIYERNK